MLREHFRLLPVLRNKLRGFSLVEVLLVAVILSVIIGVCLYALNAAQVSFNLTLAQRNLQSEVGRTIGWIVKDSRQAVSWDIANNNPTPDYVKFRQVIGWDTVNNTFSLSSNYIEYTYNALAHTITRRDIGGVTREWILSNVFSSPFFTIDSLGSIVPLNNSDLLTSKQLVITISGQSSVLNLPDTTYSLTERVRIRNG
ncbi:MAG: prepilin-type N-terminal cleavage/methylation domain-containing protein [Candidatus Omnitrophica bacterium]|nr:prepilin-type N-terminal cleavage/methylation domain-containing protein [Candidatus Omnitrophota bacterium]MBU4302914.1 prepilin-type N-terminal cleavage/methylation domain-containing protein [Candidatus Omnitrophota bacterium]MBU4468322.1 prepilin-type N-terminal cleavage/methylation domain-containing protein [Candidatus Omnitrophota bacterium]MCG2707202.1 prepilin-type N-terminal cleavage/methylation domain-containing protein [Candidatus Omnitrophota bacterium]